LPALEKLYLEDNEIGDAGLNALVAYLFEGAAEELTYLNVAGNPFTDLSVFKAES
jgi:hypothetical protein